MRALAARVSLWLAPGLLTACGTTWTVADVDGDGYTIADGDCWDAVEGPPGTGITGAQMSPGAVEVWYDGIDQDCGGDDDWDPDGDGWVADPEYLGRGTLGVPGVGDHRGDGDCWEAPRGTVDDAHTALNGGAQLLPEDVNPDALDDAFYDAIDANCDGASDFDADGDGYDASDVSQRDGSTGDDCDDAEALVNPGVELELCNDLDDDCDGLVDGDDDNIDPDSVRTWYADADGDGFGDASVSELSCSTLDGFVEDDTSDCDDADAAVNPAATEVCNDIDDDCDALVDSDDDSLDASQGGTEAWADADGDGYGDPFAGAFYCELPSGVVDNTLDCDDTDAAISPDAQEVCDGTDNDCDGLLDDDDDSIDLSTTTTYYDDADGDGYGEPGSGVESCRPPSDTVLDDTDCDDTDAAVNPGATEVVGDGKDGDCDGTESCYVDADDDGYRPDATSTVASADGDCDDAGEAVTGDPTGDCDEADASVNPGATEVDADGVDSDCDGTEICWVDADADGYADSSGATVTSSDGDCDDAGETTSASPQTDCDDSEPLSNPGAAEVCNDGIDNDCDAATTCALESGSLADAAVKFTGEGAAHSVGLSGSFLGDIDGDGVEDLALGAPSFDTSGAANRGAVYFVYGSTSVFDVQGNEVEGAISAGYRFQGSRTSANAGRAVAGGDIDGDGIHEVVVGAPGYLSEQGRTWLLEGPVTAAARVTNLAASATGRVGHAEQAGWALTLDGDTDGDGLADALIAAPQAVDAGTANYGAGQVALLLGADVVADGWDAASEVTWDGSSTGDATGFALAWSDLDGDGFDDALIGAQLGEPGSTLNNAGAVYVVSGPATAGGSLDAGEWFPGSTTAARAGYSLAAHVDMDGDGYEDLVTGSPLDDSTATNGGAVLVVQGGASVLGGTGASLSSWAAVGGAAGNDRFGHSVAAAGDVDGDGSDDLVVGAWKESTAGNNAGAGYIVYGPLTAGTIDAGLSSAVVSLTAESGADLAGWSVSGGDLNGDGLGDVLVGAPQDDDGGANAGALYLFFGLSE